MTTRHALPVLAALAALALTGCGQTRPVVEPATPATWTAGPLGTYSECDQFGNRVYWIDAYKGGSIAVVGKDATCPQPKVDQ